MQNGKSCSGLNAARRAAMRELRFFDPRDPDTGYLSNFYRATFTIDGQSWPSVEHYYQAQKFEDESQAERIRLARTPREAKTLGQSRDLPLCAEWASRKMTVMLEALAAKFSQNSALQSRLLATGDALLVEASPIDAAWGIGHDGQGENRLGYLLTSLRDEMAALLAVVPEPDPVRLAEACVIAVRATHANWWRPAFSRTKAPALAPQHRDANCQTGNLPPDMRLKYQPVAYFGAPNLRETNEHLSGFGTPQGILRLSGSEKHVGNPVKIPDNVSAIDYIPTNSGSGTLIDATPVEAGKTLWDTASESPSPPHCYRFERTLGVLAILIGTAIATNLLCYASQPLLMIVMPLVLIGFGGCLLWQPHILN
jgi:ribA/ribD-fused uncharacterized protein